MKYLNILELYFVIIMTAGCKKKIERIYSYSILIRSCKQIFPKNSIFPPYRRGKNLKEILAPS